MIIMMIKYMPHAHFKVHKAPEANLCVCIISEEIRNYRNLPAFAKALVKETK